MSDWVDRLKAESFGSGFRTGFSHGQGNEQLEAQRRAELWKPFRGNDPALLRAMRCKVLRPFSVAGRRVELGEIVELQYHDALSLRAIGKLEFVE